MTDADRDFVLKNLEDGRHALLRSIDGLSEAQLLFKPHPDRWSIVDCVAHVAIGEERMFSAIRQGKPNPNGVSLPPEKDAKVIAAVASRAQGRGA